MIGDQVWTQVVIVLGSIITTYITVKHGPKLTDKLRGTSKEPPSSDKFEIWFKGYERTIKFLDDQNTIKDRKINKLEEINENMQIEIEESRRIIAELREDNKVKQKTINKLEHSVAMMRKKFDSNWENGTA